MSTDVADKQDFTPIDPAVVPRFADIATFMRTRRCVPMEEVDIAMVGVPVIGGITPRDAQVILRSLRGREIVGADISEVSPCFDPTGITCVTVANLKFEMLCVMADAIHWGRG